MWWFWRNAYKVTNVQPQRSTSTQTYPELWYMEGGWVWGGGGENILPIINNL